MEVAAGLRYQGDAARPGHVESWFLKANDPESRRAFWLKWTVWASARAPGVALAEVWAVAFGAEGGHVVTKASVPFSVARFGLNRLDVAVDGCTLTAEAARGRVESGGRSIAYDLGIGSRAAPLLHFPLPWMYSGPWPAQKMASPVPGALVSGTVRVGGEAWRVEGWPGMVGHNWGPRHAPLYAWGQCNAWDEGEDLVLEGVSIGAGGPGVGATLLCMQQDGVRHDMNGVLSLARNAGAITPRRWRFQGRSKGLAVDGELWADSDDFVGLFYPNPDGSTSHALNSKLARAEVTVRAQGAATRTFRSSRAALGIGTLNPHHGVRMYS